MLLRPLLLAIAILLPLWAAPLNAAPWSEILRAFFGSSPEQVEQLIRDLEQRAYQTTPQNSHGRFGTLTRGIRNRVGEMVHKRSRSISSPRSGSAPRSGSSPRSDSAAASAAGPVRPLLLPSSPRSAGSSPRSAGSSPRRSPLASPTHDAAALAALRLCAASSVKVDSMGFDVAWIAALTLLSPRDLRQVSQVNRYLKEIVMGVRSSALHLWGFVYRRLAVAPICLNDSGEFHLRLADELLHRLIIEVAQIDLNVLHRAPEGILPSQAKFRAQPLAFHNLLAAAVHGGASRRLLRFDPYAIFEDFNIQRKSGSNFILESLDTARLTARFFVEPNLYADIYALAQTGHEEAQSVVVRAIVDLRLRQDERAVNERINELLGLAEMGWESAREALAELLDVGMAGFPVPDRMSEEKLQDFASLGWVAAQKRIVERLVRDRQILQLLELANRGWPSAQTYIVKAIANGGPGYEHLEESDRIRQIELCAANGWLDAQEFILLHLANQCEESKRERYGLLCELSTRDPQLNMPALKKILEPCLHPDCPRGMNTFAALYALAARGWPVAQRLVIAEVERTEERSSYPTKAQLLRWYFDVLNQVRGLQAGLAN